MTFHDSGKTRHDNYDLGRYYDCSPEMYRVCLHCGRVYGVHRGNVCPEEGGYYVPKWI